MAWVIAAVSVLTTPVNACLPPIIDFEYGSARLTAADESQIAELAKTVRMSRGTRIRLVRQSDGSRANLRMSQVRTAAIRKAFIRHGVPASKIEIETRIGSEAVFGGEGYARWVIIDVISAPSC